MSVFWVHPNGSSGEVPDGTRLPGGARPVTEAEYLAHQAAEVEEQRDNRNHDQASGRDREQQVMSLRRSGWAKLVELGLSDAEAAAIAGLPVEEV